MRFSQRLFLLAGIMLLFPVSGGELEELSKELDYIEHSFTYAAMQSARSENRQQMENKLINFHNRLIRFERQLHLKKVPGVPNLLIHSAELKQVFTQLTSSTSYSRLPRYRGTSLGNYSKTYNEYLRDINRLEGKKNRGNRNIPTLKSIPLSNYKVWLERTAQNYIQNIRSLSRHQDRSKKNKHRNHLPTSKVNLLENYIVSVAKLRLCFAMIAQNKFYNETDAAFQTRPASSKSQSSSPMLPVGGFIPPKKPGIIVSKKRLEPQKKTLINRQPSSSCCKGTTVRRVKVSSNQGFR